MPRWWPALLTAVATLALVGGTSHASAGMVTGWTWQSGAGGGLLVTFSGGSEFFPPLPSGMVPLSSGGAAAMDEALADYLASPLGDSVRGVFLGRSLSADAIAELRADPGFDLSALGLASLGMEELTPEVVVGDPATYPAPKPTASVQPVSIMPHSPAPPPASERPTPSAPTTTASSAAVVKQTVGKTVHALSSVAPMRVTPAVPTPGRQEKRSTGGRTPVVRRASAPPRGVSWVDWVLVGLLAAAAAAASWAIAHRRRSVPGPGDQAGSAQAKPPRRTRQPRPEAAGTSPGWSGGVAAGAEESIRWDVEDQNL